MECNESVCLEHSGIDERMKNLERENGSQWRAIGKMEQRYEAMEKRSIKTLTAVCMTLIGIVINICVVWAKS